MSAEQPPTTPQPSECPSREEWRRYLRGEVEASGTDRFDVHMHSCPRCGGLFSTLEKEFGEILAHLRGRPPQEEFAEEPECRQALQSLARLANGPAFQKPRTENVDEAGEPARGRPSLFQRLVEKARGVLR